MRGLSRIQNRVALLVLLAAAPAWLASAWWLWSSGANAALRWIAFISISAFMMGGALAVRRRVMQPLRSLANLLEALREGDYSLRGRSSDPDDAVGEVMVELNLLSQMLYDGRLAALEAGVLLDKVIAEIDIAVFAFDAGRRLRLVNPAGEALLGAEAAQLIGRSAAALEFTPLFEMPSGRIVSRRFPGGRGRWEIRRRQFREGGRPHELLVISDLSHALRDEERQAWRRLVRVMGHELNSSLAPIKSMAGTLRKLTGRDKLPEDWRGDVQAGLKIIQDRAEALGRFMSGYARLARLPPPVLKPVHFAGLVRRAASLYGAGIVVEDGPDLALAVDADQIEQVLINLVKNAVEAAGDTQGVRVGWRVANDSLLVEIEDDGPGLAQTENLWVPFFTTKPGGTGIGLALSREIIENHGGAISLENRAGAHGCVACISLPLGRSARLA